MSLILQAPWPQIQTVSILPDPELQDAIGIQGHLDIKRAMSGLYYSYIRGGQRFKFTYTWNHLAVLKAEELKAFLDSYSSSTIQLINFKNEILRVAITNNPFEFETVSRYAKGVTPETCLPRPEAVKITLEFQGIKVGQL